MEDARENRRIELDRQMIRNLNATRKWTMFISIIGFIVLGILILFGLITGTFLSLFRSGDAMFAMNDLLMILVMLAVIIMYFFPVWFLYRFSTHAAKAVQLTDTKEFNAAFRYLRRYFVYIGIVIIMGLVAYAAVLVISGASLPFLLGGAE